MSLQHFAVTVVIYEAHESVSPPPLLLTIAAQALGGGAQGKSGFACKVDEDGWTQPKDSRAGGGVGEVAFRGDDILI